MFKWLGYFMQICYFIWKQKEEEEISHNVQTICCQQLTERESHARCFLSFTSLMYSDYLHRSLNPYTHSVWTLCDDFLIYHTKIAIVRGMLYVLAHEYVNMNQFNNIYIFVRHSFIESMFCNKHQNDNTRIIKLSAF